MIKPNGGSTALICSLFPMHDQFRNSGWADGTCLPLYPLSDRIIWILFNFDLWPLCIYRNHRHWSAYRPGKNKASHRVDDGKISQDTEASDNTGSGVKGSKFCRARRAQLHIQQPLLVVHHKKKMQASSPDRLPRNSIGRHAQSKQDLQRSLIELATNARGEISGHLPYHWNDRNRC